MVDLRWEGKYHDDTRIRPGRTILGLDTVEAFAASAPAEESTPWRNRLIWGDKRHVLPTLLPEVGGQVQLIYIDPPFTSGVGYARTVALPGRPGSATARVPTYEQPAYGDRWARGLDAYLQWFSETAQLLHELLVVGGTIYVHLGWRAASYVRVVLDEIFGAASYRNEIVWKRHNARAAARDAWPRLHDDLLVYVKGRRGVFHPQRVPAPAARLPHTLVTGPDGKKYQTYELTAPGPTREGESGRPWRGFDPGRWGRHWSVGHEVLEALAAQGLIHWPARGGFPRRRAAEPFVPGERLVTVGDVWTDIDRINQAAGERWGYPTQKPERLLERIIAASSNPGDLVLDCFAGSGTTAVVAERLGRRWIVSDRGRLAVATTRRRLAALGSVRPFLVQDLGASERRVWVASLDRAGDETAREASHRRRVLERYGAQRIAGGAWLHGRKGGRWVHVAPAEGPIGLDDLTALAREAARVGAPEAEAATVMTRAPGLAATRPAVDVLGWEFDRTLDDAVAALAKELDVTLQLRLIPRELTSEDALDPVPIAASDFAPLRTLHAHVSVVGREATVELLGFELPAEGAPPRLGPAITHWSQWLDGWAVDWAHEDKVFRPRWQVFRTRAQGELPLRETHRYDAPGRFRVAVRAFDLVGQETTVFLDAEVS